MGPVLRVAQMSAADLETALGWAAAEGWNPGLDDPGTFREADPEGFLMGWLGDTPVACISVVRHSETFGFLGLYICHPAFRGQGHGLALWQAGMAFLGERTVGLDGVPAQEPNYARSGFIFAFRAHRYEGEIAGHLHPAYQPAHPSELEDLIALDRAVGGAARPAYMRAWLENGPTRQTLVRREGGRVVAMGTIRACQSGHKIGPVIAHDADTAHELVASLGAVADAKRIAIDIPESSVPGSAWVRGAGLESAFACARMYKGKRLEIDMNRLVALASFELG